jgi:hypothetical protein
VSLLLHLLPFLPALSALASELPEASDPVESRVFVSTFESSEKGARELGRLLPDRIGRELAGQAGLRVVGVSEAPAIGGQDASLYMEACPKGEIVGCTFVVAEKSEARYAITGRVDLMESTAFVEVILVDVTAAREIMTLGFHVEGDNTFNLTTGISRVVLALSESGEYEEEDLREGLEETEAQRLARTEKAEAARELEEVSGELGVSGADVRRTDTVIKRPKLTEADIRRASRTDGITPWERLAMSSAEYLRYKNSGLDLLEWRRRNAGRTLQLLLRPHVDLYRGPVDQRYNGRYMVGYIADQGALGTLETYAFQQMETGLGFAYGISVGFGFLPFLDVEAEIGRVSGTYLVNIQQDQQGKTSITPKDQLFGTTSTRFGAGVRFVPLPVSRIRPVLGVGFFAWRGTAVGDHVVLSVEELPTFPAPTAMGLRIRPGAEVGLSQRLDGIVTLPFDLFATGLDPESRRDGEPLLENLVSPQKPTSWGAGLEVGLQFRLGGKRFKAQREVEEDE